MAIKDLKAALLRIEELEAENAKMREELEVYRARKVSGRKKHDQKWMASYEHFCSLYKKGMPMKDIVDNSPFSRRTAYRFKEYYDSLQNGDAKDNKSNKK